MYFLMEAVWNNSDTLCIYVEGSRWGITAKSRGEGIGNILRGR